MAGRDCINPEIVHEWIIPESLDRSRVDGLLHRAEPSMSRSVARRLAESGGVALDGVRTPPSARARAASALSWHPEHIESTLALGLGVFYENEDFIILSKPPGLAVHGGPLVGDSVVVRLKPVAPGSGLTSRLDRETSGLLLVGKHSAALARAANWIERGLITKEYRAIAAGRIERDRFTIDLPLRVLDEPMGNRPKTIVDPKGGQPARTEIVVIDRSKETTTVSAWLPTGRTHQIRAHLAAIGHPIVGDPRYGNVEFNARAKSTWGAARTLLHCHSIEFAGENDGNAFSARAWCEPDFARVSFKH